MVFGVTACSKNTVEGDKLPDYDYTNPLPPENNWNKAPYDSDMKLDGILEEDAWKDKTAYSFTQQDKQISLITHFGDMGLYVGATVKDNTAYYNPDRNIYENTSMELYLAPIGANARGKSVIQTRVDIVNNTETWVAISTDKDYNWTRKFFPMNSGAKVNGTINTSTVESNVFEVFVPWKSFLLDSKPSEIKLIPAYNTVGGLGVGTSDGRTWITPVGVNFDDPSSYLPFNQNGYKDPESELKTMGSSDTGLKMTAGWEIDEENKIIKSTAGGEQRIYFKGINSSKYEVSTIIKRDRAINDSFPKGGLIVGENGYGALVGLFDLAQIYTKDLFAVLRPSGGEWDWPDKGVTGISAYNGSIDYVAGVKLSIIRDAKDFYYYINDQFMFKRTVDGFSASTAPGLVTFGCAVEFNDYAISTDATAIDAKINATIINTDNWEGFGGFTAVSENAVTINADQKNLSGGIAHTGRQYIKKTGVQLTGNFSLEYKTRNIALSVDQPEWMWPQLSLNLYKDNGFDTVALGAAEKQMRFESEFSGGGWQNSNTFGKLDFKQPHTVRIERDVNDKVAVVRLYIDGKYVTMRNSDYVGDYGYGFSYNFCSGEIYDIAVGSIQKYSVTLPSQIDNGEITADKKENIFSGDLVTLTIAPDDGYRIKTFTVNGENKKAEISDGVYAFYVVSNVTVTIEFETIPDTKYTVSGKITATGEYSNVGNATVKANDGTEGVVKADGTYTISLPEGEYTLTFALVRYANKTLSVSVADGNLVNQNITLTIPLNPTVNGELINKEAYYIAARKISFEGADVYGYLGTDGMYLLWDVADKSLGGAGATHEFDNIEFTYTTPNYLTDYNKQNKVYKLLININGAAYNDKHSGTGWVSGDVAYVKAITLDGTVNNADDEDTGYKVEVMVPYSSLNLTAKPEFMALALARVDVGGNGWKINSGDFDVPQSYSVLTDTKFVNADSVGTLKTIDANLDDWTDFDTESYKIKEMDGSRGVNYQMIKGDNGLYVAGIAKVSSYNNTSSQWFENLNVEMFLGNIQIGFSLNSENNLVCTRILPFEAKIIISEKGDDNLFTVTFEIFVGQSFGNEKDSTVGFAFKTGSAIKDGYQPDKIKIINRDKNSEDEEVATDWWWIDQHFPSNIAEQFVVNKDGIKCGNAAHGDHKQGE